MVLGDAIFIPIPEAVAKTFIPTDAAKKRFEDRCDLLYPEFAITQSGAAAEGDGAPGATQGVKEVSD
jgi:hypothetical protein